MPDIEVFFSRENNNYVQSTYFLSEDHNFELIVNAISLVEFDYLVGHLGNR